MDMSWAVLAGLLVLGLAAGVLSGRFGIGGGLVIVPALVILFGLTQKTATGTSLFAILWPVGLLGVLEYYRRGQLQIWPGAMIAIGLFLGAYLGARITAGLSPAQMKRIYGSFLIIIGIYYLLGDVTGRIAQARDDVPARPDRQEDLTVSKENHA